MKVAQKDLPDIKVNVLRLSTGDLAARLIAEAGNPRNDVIWALSLTNMLDARILALTEDYTPRASSACRRNSRSRRESGSRQPDTWRPCASISIA